MLTANGAQIQPSRTPPVTDLMRIAYGSADRPANRSQSTAPMASANPRGIGSDLLPGSADSGAIAKTGTRPHLSIARGLVSSAAGGVSVGYRLTTKPAT